jgi:hypothetical protein
MYFCGNDVLFMFCMKCCKYRKEKAPDNLCSSSFLFFQPTLEFLSFLLYPGFFFGFFTPGSQLLDPPLHLKKNKSP